MRRKCCLPKIYEELKGLSPKELRFYWNAFYTYPLKGVKAQVASVRYGTSPNVG